MADVEDKKPNYAGMTINERLFVASLYDRFDDAARARDRARLVALLTQVEVADPDRSADEILDNPEKFRY